MANPHPLPSPRTAASNWTPERVERLLALNERAMSATQIAKELGGVTRSAVLGKLNRMGMGLKTGDAMRRAAALRPKRAPRPEAHAKPKLIVVGNGAVMEKPDSRRKPWVDPVALLERANAPAGEVRAFTGQVGPKPCLWPIGTPGEPDYHSCGQPAVVGKPYCPGHGQRAVQPRKEADPAKALIRSVRRYA